MCCCGCCCCCCCWCVVPLLFGGFLTGPLTAPPLNLDGERFLVIFCCFCQFFALRTTSKEHWGGGGEGWDIAELFSHFWVIFQTLRNTNLCSHQAHLLEYSFLSVKVMWVKRNPLKAKSRKPQFNQSILMLF